MEKQLAFSCCHRYVQYEQLIDLLANLALEMCVRFEIDFILKKFVGTRTRLNVVKKYFILKRSTVIKA